MPSVEGVILAGGLSTRMGRFKMELPVGGKAMIVRCVEVMFPVAQRVLVVVGWQGERIRELLAGYAQVEIVPNPDYALGMFSSVKAGIARVRAERFFLLPGDHALVGTEVYLRMLAAPGDIVIPTFQGRKGHPVLIARTLIPEILAQPPDHTLRDAIRNRGFVTVEVPDAGILVDVDTPAEYDAAARVRALGRERARSHLKK
jgi:molybdenum cofactor cytidylyltransferase